MLKWVCIPWKLTSKYLKIDFPEAQQKTGKWPCDSKNAADNLENK